MTNLEISINYSPATPGTPESVFGIVRHCDGSQTYFGGWLSLLTVLQSVASDGADRQARPTQPD